MASIARIYIQQITTASAWHWKVVWLWGQRTSSACWMSMSVTAVCHWKCSFACRMFCAVGGGHYPRWSAACSVSFSPPLLRECPAPCPQLLPPSSPVCPVALRPSFLCYLPSTPQHKRGHWQRQTGRTYTGVCCRHWRTSASSGSRAGSDPSCKARLCWLTSLVYCLCELLDISYPMSWPLPWQTLPKNLLQIHTSEQCQAAFERVKKDLCGRQLLYTPNFKLPFVLQTDTSNMGLAPGALIHPFFGSHSASVAPSHEGHQRTGHPLVSRFT